jgi:type IV pilus assembly protein PilY1
VAAAGTVTISAPGAVTATPVVTKSGSMSVGTTAFARPSTNRAAGENLLTVITATTTTYPKVGARSDCAADPCTYAEEMTNYANWWAYYRTRMLTMKTAASLSFEPIGSRFRIGYMTINNNTSTDFQNIDVFNAAQKKAWYDKLFSAIPNLNTPLRVALSNAGRLYAGRLNETSFNGVDVVDPVQFYCQPNVTILSTDGYWNEGAGFKWDGTTAVGDQDGPTTGEVRPQLDGGGFQEQRSTEQMKKSTTPGDGRNGSAAEADLPAADAHPDGTPAGTDRSTTGQGLGTAATSDAGAATDFQRRRPDLECVRRCRFLLAGHRPGGLRDPSPVAARPTHPAALMSPAARR